MKIWKVTVVQKWKKSTSEKFKKRVSMFCFEIIIICCFGLNNVNRGNQSFAKPSFELFLIFLKFCPSVYGHEIKRSAMNKRTWSHLNLKLVEAHTYLLTTYNKFGVTVYSTIVPQLVQRFKNEKEKNYNHSYSYNRFFYEEK